MMKVYSLEILCKVYIGSKSNIAPHMKVCTRNSITIASNSSTKYSYFY